MKAGSGKMERIVEVMFAVQCSRCAEESATKLGSDIVDRGAAAGHFRGRGWVMRKGKWVCPACLRNEEAGSGTLAGRVAAAAQKAADNLSREARKEKDRDAKRVSNQDASDFRMIRDLAKAGDLKAAAKHYRNMDTAARDYLECDDEALEALGFERIVRRRR